VPKELLTQFSGHANTIADTFRAAFAKHKIGGCSIDMTAPEGSTHGGLLALQHLTLHASDGLNIVVGTVNAQEKRAELRAYDVVAKIYEERFKKPVPFARPEYEGFVERAKPILGAFGLEVAVTDAPHHPVAPMADAEEMTSDASRSRWRLFLVISLILFAGIAVLLFVR
jgi:hypothetical protein